MELVAEDVKNRADLTHEVAPLTIAAHIRRWSGSCFATTKVGSDVWTRQNGAGLCDRKTVRGFEGETEDTMVRNERLLRGCKMEGRGRCGDRHNRRK